MQNSQLILNFPRRQSLQPHEFMPMACNAEALHALDRLLAAGHGVLYVYGQSGVGKSHFLHVAAARLGTHPILPEQLPPDPTQLNCAVIDALEEADAAAQERLFHLYNHIQARGGLLVVAAGMPARRLPLLADLVSRLTTVEHIEMRPPDTAHLELLLVKLAADRQLELEPAVVRYMLRRADRSPRALEAMLDALDAASLTAQKKVTIPLARQVLEAAAGGR